MLEHKSEVGTFQSNKWITKVLDIKSAFFQGQLIERDAFLKPPKEAGTNKFWKFKITIHELNDASRQLYLKIKDPA